MAEPNEDTSCQQCGAERDGAERPYTFDGRPVWLHPQCARYYQPKPGR